MTGTEDFLKQSSKRSGCQRERQETCQIRKFAEKGFENCACRPWGLLSALPSEVWASSWKTKPSSLFYSSKTQFLSRALNSAFHGGMTASGNRPETHPIVSLAVKASMLMLSWSTNLWQMLQQKILMIRKRLFSCWKSTRTSNGSLWRISSSTLNKLSQTKVNQNLMSDANNTYLQSNWSMLLFNWFRSILTPTHTTRSWGGSNWPLRTSLA